jgi:hypothetical protein
VAEFFDSSGGWVEEPIDLSAYLGRVIYLVWHHQLLSLETVRRPGWLIDDVSITVTTVQPGTIVVSNNLSQARYQLAGPLKRSGQGLWTVISNAPPGEYTATFSSVSYFQTPTPVTRTLAAGGELRFDGHYTFNDANGNGLSDEWEQFYFGNVAADHPGSRDTDQDGMTDLAEFAAGTSPIQAVSRLNISRLQRLNGGFLQIAWPSAAGRAYRVEGSVDAVTWVPISDFITATGSITSFNIPERIPGSPHIFRVEVWP